MSCKLLRIFKNVDVVCIFVCIHIVVYLSLNVYRSEYNLKSFSSVSVSGLEFR